MVALSAPHPYKYEFGLITWAVVVVVVAQLVERRIVIPVVAGSSPVDHPIFPKSNQTSKRNL